MWSLELTLHTKRTSDAEIDCFFSFLDVSLGKGMLSSVACLFLFVFCFILFCLLGFILFYLLLVWFVFPLKECINNLKRQEIYSLSRCRCQCLYLLYVYMIYIKSYLEQKRLSICQCILFNLWFFWMQKSRGLCFILLTS